VQLLGRAIDAVRGSHQVSAVAYGTDASTLAEAGIPAVVFGPGDIAKAHTCDEWVPLEEVEQASEILYRLACSSSQSAGRGPHARDGHSAAAYTTRTRSIATP